MIMRADCELLAEWNHRRDKEGKDTYLEQLGNPPQHICEAVEHGFDDPEADVDC
jgi:hypothetical protein